MTSTVEEDSSGGCCLRGSFPRDARERGEWGGERAREREREARHTRDRTYEPGRCDA